jgi:threonine dehydratase
MFDLTDLPTAADVKDAAMRLATVAVKTPLLRSDILDERVGGHVLLKAECLQRTGAFKFRGAYNILSRLSRDRYPGGVVAYSTGNHGQAIATVAKMLDIQATIVMPADAPTVKVGKVRQQGGVIRYYDRRTESREEISAQIATEKRAAIIPPGDNRYVIAGQGTIALEALEQAGRAVDAILVPCGGGGLTAGTCLAAEAAASRAEIWPVEPADFNDTFRSLEAGRRLSNDRVDGSICDALLAKIPAEMPFAVYHERVAGALAASDAEVLSAMRFAFEEFRIVLEPGGAVALAAALARPARLRDRTTVIIASGGNVDAAIFTRIFGADEMACAA